MIGRFFRRRDTDRRIALALQELTTVQEPVLGFLDIEREETAMRLDDLRAQRLVKEEKIAWLHGEIDKLETEVLEISLAIAAQEAAESVLARGGQLVTVG